MKKSFFISLSTINLLTPMFIISCKHTEKDLKNIEEEQNKNNFSNSINEINFNLDNYIYDDSNKYYEELNGLKGDALFTALYNLQRKHISGIGNYGDLYKIYETAFIDKYFEKNGTILDIYSEVENGKDPYEYPVGYYDGMGSKGKLKTGKKEGTVYNREHMIPQSKFNKVNPTRNDAHFVWPSDKWVNEKRGNLPHFNVGQDGKLTLNGTKINKKYAEPINLFKGDTARAYFYFQATHKNANWPEVFKKTYPYFTDKFLKGYIEWSILDKVDIIEIERNNEIAKAQKGLRNPFIDYPDLISLIWGNSEKTFKNKGILIGIKNA
ncbi:Extracellular ribonuclease precursor [Mycoplasmopsis maculosa]|uniref:Extracellular ribonuclease n=1 Tax=Mycoplasmopsis maculosa TaxID=114885 RepID=A0A449B4Y0_9BACT|nr:endonuclease [Mycoplasmopsis maculosa]VEU75663.1 Extracellular ribonuclease precursor [Mycoplasmopsis maculosa]